MALVTSCTSGVGSNFLDVDEGGDLVQYKFAAAKFNQSGKPVRFTGKCKSACTVLLSVKNKCTAPDTGFYFHAARTQRDGQEIFSQVGTDVLMNSYPPQVQNHIVRKGGLKMDEWIIIDGRQMIAWGVMPECQFTRSRSNSGDTG